jgi:tRNA-2-methylthio-N6-dimethylallyladenosine synthase
MNKYLYIKTMGCQMNVYDSNLFAESLKPLGYKLTPFIELSDIIILNTCSIRQKASQKAFSFLGRIRKLKKQKKNLIIAVCGCIAQQKGINIIKRMPHVDLILGTHTQERLVEYIKKIKKHRKPIVDTEFSEKIIENRYNPPQNANISEFVTIMRGCDNFCTYCIVPYVRGRESSRTPENIISEIKMLVKNGAKEVTLLGQNVNSYGKKENLCSFSQLLFMVNEIKGLKRIRFTTSHPKDLSDELIYAFKNIEKLCPHMHLPVQSGSDAVLKKMNRKYTRALYLEKIEKLKNAKPEIAISSDFIVGFPGETKKDFNDTIDLIKKIEFDSSFAFIYSPRPKTPAAKLAETVSETEKSERLYKLLEVQKHYAQKKNRAFIGKKTAALVEGNSKQAGKNGNFQLTGRTDTNKIVNFETPESDNNIIGEIVKIKIKKAFSNSLYGEIV